MFPSENLKKSSLKIIIVDSFYLKSAQGHIIKMFEYPAVLPLPKPRLEICSSTLMCLFYDS